MMTLFILECSIGHMALQADVKIGDSSLITTIKGIPLYQLVYSSGEGSSNVFPIISLSKFNRIAIDGKEVVNLAEPVSSYEFDFSNYLHGYDRGNLTHTLQIFDGNYSEGIIYFGSSFLNASGVVIACNAVTNESTIIGISSPNPIIYLPDEVWPEEEYSSDVTSITSLCSIGGRYDKTEKIYIASGISTIYPEAFNKCESLKEIVINDSEHPLVLKNNSTTSYSPLFANIPLETLYIGRSLIPSVDYARLISPTRNCKYLKKVEFGNLPILFDDNAAFQGCENLYDIEIPINVTLDWSYSPYSNGSRKSFFTDCISLTNVAIFSPVHALPTDIFTNCTSLTTISLPETITQISGGAFNSCSALEKIEFPNALTDIGEYTFAGCVSLKNVSLPNGFLTLGNKSFYNNSKLEEVVLPESIISFGNDIFEGCEAIRKIVYNTSNFVCPSSSQFFFDNTIYNKANLYVADDAIELAKTQPVWGSFKNILPYSSLFETEDRFTVDGVTYSTTGMAPNTCKVIGSVSNNISIPDEVLFNGIRYFVKEVADNAFENTQLESVIFEGTTLEKIGERAFANTNISEITIPYGTLEIANGAFENCFNLETVNLPENILTSIGNSTFNHCIKLKSISLPGSLNYLGADAFRECSNLSEVSFGAGLTTIRENTFMATGLTNLILPETVSTIAANAFIMCENLEKVLFLSPQLYLMEGSFWHCPNLKEICIIADQLPSLSTNKNPFDKTNINIYVNKPLFETLLADGVWNQQNIIVREIAFPDGKIQLTIGSIYGFGYVIHDSSLISHNVNFSSSNTNIFTYSDSFDVGGPFNIPGDFIKGRNIGDGYLLATSTYGLTGECPVQVYNKPSDFLIVSNFEGIIGLDETGVLDILPVPLDALVTPTWISDNTSVVKIKSIIDNGQSVVLEGVGLGECNITARDHDLNISKTYHVTVVNRTQSFELNPKEWLAKKGDTCSLNIVVSPEGSYIGAIEWTSDNEEVATVNEEGVISANGIGQAIISASNGVLTATCSVSVIPTPVISITLDRTEWCGEVGESLMLLPTVLPEDATDKTITWTSDNPMVASVDENGNVTALSLGQAVIVAACGDVSASCIVEVVATPVESITLSQDAAQLKVGESLTLFATVLPENATDKTVFWTSDNAEVASVDEAGNVTALSLGQAVIMASCGEVSASCTIDIVATPVESIQLNYESAILQVGNIYPLAATVFPEDATDRTVTWTSDNTEVATVGDEGTVRALSIGSATIAASCGEVSAYCYVTVVATPVESITLSQDYADLTIGEHLSLTATVLPESVTNKDIVWSSSDATVAGVDSDGNVIAISVGEADIIAMAADGSGISATCHVVVNPVLVEAILLSPDRWSWEEGQSFKIEATVLPDNATDKTLEWSTSNDKVAEVDGEGNVTVLHEGTCVITASATDGSGIYAECIVTELTGIDAIFAEDKVNIDIYDMNGILLKKGCNKEDLKKLTPDIYIIRSSNTIKKVVIR